MGENLSVPGRYAVRTPMQWTSEPGAGFTSEDQQEPVVPFADGDFGPERVNVHTQRSDPESLLNWFERLIRRRRETPELALGHVTVVPTDPVPVFAHRCTWDGTTVVAVHNLSTEPVAVTVPLGLDGDEEVDGAEDLLQGGFVEAVDRRIDLDLDRYGYRWLRLHRPGHRFPP